LKEESFELRRYEPHILAETVVDGDFEGAGNKAFSRLFKYISGSNTSSEKVAMTSPVGQQPQSEKIDMTSPVGQQQVNDQWVVSFTMPASFTLETLPQPADPAVTLREVPARYMAAVRYSGFWSEKSYRLNKEKLEAWIASQSLTVVGEPAWARYDPPFKPWFLRRNEILVPVADPSR
ncbi:MAG: heme-binding protein, partial [Haliea sp.]|nr:heme-binding protein [Haliea sp.]